MARYTIDNRPGNIDFSGSDQTRRILQNVKNLIMLRKGELPYDRLRGIDSSIIGRNLVEANSLISPEVDRVLKWERRAVCMKAAVKKDTDGETILQIEVEV